MNCIISFAIVSVAYGYSISSYSPHSHDEEELGGSHSSYGSRSGYGSHQNLGYGSHQNRGYGSSYGSNSGYVQQPYSLVQQSHYGSQPHYGTQPHYGSYYGYQSQPSYHGSDLLSSLGGLGGLGGSSIFGQLGGGSSLFSQLGGSPFGRSPFEQSPFGQLGGFGQHQFGPHGQSDFVRQMLVSNLLDQLMDKHIAEINLAAGKIPEQTQVLEQFAAEVMHLGLHLSL